VDFISYLADSMMKLQKDFSNGEVQANASSSEIIIMVLASIMAANISVETVCALQKPATNVINKDI
jgi:hypothetical protein